MKRCSSCGRSFPLSEFHRNPSTVDGHDCRCRICKCAAVADYRRRNRENINARRRAQRKVLGYGDQRERERRLAKYGITPERYDALLAEQGGVCAICERPERTKANNGQELKLLAVDHDHKTGRVRGLLCAQCNKGIGNLGDDPQILLNAFEYVASGSPTGALVSELSA